jgi:hypothetical protein
MSRLLLVATDRRPMDRDRRQRRSGRSTGKGAGIAVTQGLRYVNERDHKPSRLVPFTPL